jgi:hypothetical protein
LVVGLAVAVVVDAVADLLACEHTFAAIVLGLGEVVVDIDILRQTLIGASPSLAGVSGERRSGAQLGGVGLVGLAVAVVVLVVANFGARDEALAAVRARLI